MGLNMYLHRKVYVGATFAHNKVEGEINLTQMGKPIKVDLSKVSEIVETVGDWRKANAIHGWFVQNVQKGEDDCKEYYVSFEQLTELLTLCQRVLATKDTSLLPPTEGFFFGSNDIDEGYWDDLHRTVGILTALDPDGDYYYQSSW